MNDVKKVPLASLARELTTMTGSSPSYRKLWSMIVNGELPAEQVNGRYVCDPNAVASALGLTKAA